MNYAEFIESKTQLAGEFGFDPVFMPEFLFPFQRALVEWAVKKGRAAIFADCGLGKTAMQLTWAQNVVEKTNGNVLILTPLAVGSQTVREAEKFGIDAGQSRDGKTRGKITVTNYQQLPKFDSKDFAGVVCDESSILKNFDGAIKKQITDFMRKLKYRLLCTATAAPNDYIELGTSSEALGYLRRVEMMAQFFNHDGGDTSKWRLKKHAAKSAFWKWITTWARAVRIPSDIGFSDQGYELPELRVNEHVVSSVKKNANYLFDMPAIGMDEQRDERKRTINERCETAAAMINKTDRPAVAWCHLNPEGDLLEKLIPGSVQISGCDSDEEKERAFDAFASGEIRVIVSKPVIAGFGLNWQHCAHQTFFPSHSFEQWYQAIRRCWRFGQKNQVTIDVVTSPGEANVVKNMMRKSDQADEMFSKMVSLLGHQEIINQPTKTEKQQTIPTWI
jgi:hypothetical protein